MLQYFYIYALCSLTDRLTDKLFIYQMHIYKGNMQKKWISILNSTTRSVSFPKVMGSMLGLNSVIAKDVRSCTTAMTYARHYQYEQQGNALAQNRCNSGQYKVRTSLQRSYNQSVSCLQELGFRAFGPAIWSGPQKPSPEILK